MGSSNTDRENEFKYNDSDVDIISNPSQSSIEVLDHYASRKTSEERRISQIPNLETIDDNSYSQSFIEREFGDLILNRTLENESIKAKSNKSEFSKNDNTQSSQENKLNTPLTTFNLTESSSSGSVTDSICTAYEQGAADRTLVNAKETQKQTKNLLDSEKKDTQSKNYNTLNASGTSESDAIGQKKEEGVSSMFGGR